MESLEFNPDMLIVAREAVGHTQGTLAKELGVSQAYISQVEHGLKVPSVEMIERFGVVLERPLGFFTQPGRRLGEGLVDFFHKKRQTLPAKPLRRAHATVNAVRLELDRLLETVDLTGVQPLLNLVVGEDGSPETIATLVRSVWRAPSGPLQNLTAYVESLGVPVVVTDLSHRKLAAISVPLESGSHLIVLNGGLPASEQRFALAHELGHLVMHSHLDELGELERDADRFAAELLMPESEIRHELRGMRFRDLGTLKSRWRVSMAALIYRANTLRAVYEDEATLLYKALSAQPGGRLMEAGEFPPEEPQLVKRVIDYFLNEASYTVDQLSAVMNMTSGRLREFYLGEPRRARLRVVERDSRPNRVSFP